MELEKIVKYLDKKFSPKLAAKWDHNGFQIFNNNEIDLSRDIKKVLVCLDVNKDVVKEATSNDVDLIISRHPFVFNDLNDEKKIKKDLMKALTKSNTYIYSIHTNYDASPNQELLNILNINFDINKSKRFGEDNEGYEITLKESLKPEEFIKRINKSFKTDICQVNNSFKQLKDINHFYIVTGSAGPDILEAKLKDTVFVTGEMKWNEMVYANDNNVSIILKGHYMEEYFVDDLFNKVSNAFRDLQVEKFDIGNQVEDY